MRASILALCVACASCVTLRTSVPDVAYPVGWPSRIQSADCTPLTGMYGYFGSGTSADQHSPEITEAFLSRRTGPGTYPETASISISADGTKASLALRGKTLEVIDVAGSCINGQLAIEQVKQGYSDGTKYETRGEAQLWRATDGELVAYVSHGMRSDIPCCLGETPFQTREWFRFKRIQ